MGKRKEGKRIERSESSTPSGNTKKAGRENRRRRNLNSQEATTSTSRLTLTTSSTTDSLSPQPLGAILFIQRHFPSKKKPYTAFLLFQRKRSCTFTHYVSSFLYLHLNLKAHHITC